MNMVAMVDGQPQAAQPEAGPRRLPAPPPRSRHAPHHVRTAQGARTRPHPRRPGGGAVQRGRDHRADQGGTDARRCQARTDGAHLALVAGGRHAGARQRCIAPGWPGARIRPGREGNARLSPVRRAGAGDSGTAPAAPDRAGAGQDRRRVPRGDGQDHRPARHPGQAGARDADHRRRADRDQERSSATSAAARSSRTRRT